MMGDVRVRRDGHSNSGDRKDTKAWKVDGEQGWSPRINLLKQLDKACSGFRACFR